MSVYQLPTHLEVRMKARSHTHSLQERKARGFISSGTPVSKQYSHTGEDEEEHWEEMKLNSLELFQLQILPLE